MCFEFDKSMFNQNHVVMKTAILKKMCLTPLLLMSFCLVFLSSCEKDKDGADSLDVKVNFPGSVKPDPGDILMVVIYNSDITELDIETDIEPDVIAPVLLTQDMIDNGVTVNLDTIDLDQKQIYVGAFVDLDANMIPSPGDLIEFYQDVSLIDAFINDVLPPNVYGKSFVEIDLDDLLILPTLEVTVNFIGNTVPEVDDVLHIAIFYYNVSGLGFEELEPDDELSRVLTADDILDGVTLTFNTILPWETEVYIGAFVDANGDESPGPGELIEFYEDKDVMQVLAGLASADNVFGETAVTINLDLIIEI